MSHVNATAIWDGEEQRLRLDGPGAINALVRRRLKPGDGEVFVVRIEREADAKKHHQLKWYFGYIVKQCCRKTGYKQIEMDYILRAANLPSDVETISVMTFEQMADYIVHCEQFAAEEIGVIVVGPQEARDYA